MAFTEQTIGNNTSRVAVISFCLLLALSLQGCSGDTGRRAPEQQEQQLGPMLRAGSPEFEKYREKIVLDQPEADEATRAIGDIVMTLRTTVRNFTGRTLNGLEIYAAVVDLEGKPIKERTVTVIPDRRPELENNQTMPIQVMLEGMSKDAVRANIKMQVTGIRFK
jgi:hypothetical protein